MTVEVSDCTHGIAYNDGRKVSTSRESMGKSSEAAPSTQRRKVKEGEGAGFSIRNIRGRSI